MGKAKQSPPNQPIIVAKSERQRAEMWKRMDLGTRTWAIQSRGATTKNTQELANRPNRLQACKSGNIVVVVVYGVGDCWTCQIGDGHELAETLQWEEENTDWLFGGL
jgi:hypothetical protein